MNARIDDTLPYADTVSPRAKRAHEMKNCLSVIHAISQLIEPELSERARPRLRRLCEQVLRLNVLLGDDLRREEALEVADTLVTVEEIFDLAKARAEDRASRAGVELLFARVPGVLLGDACELAEAVANLVANAIDASARGAKVVVTSRSLACGDLQWTIRDAGCGMDAEQVSRFAEPYSTRRPGGSGIGAAAAKECVLRHGGTLDVESWPGGGTTVRIVLPGPRL